MLYFINIWFKRPTQNPNFVKLSTLYNYWPFNGRSLTDIITEVDLYDGENANFTNDRFGRPYSAISLNDGFYRIPSGPNKKFHTNEFTFEFSLNKITIMAWVKILSVKYEQVLITFSSSQDSDNRMIYGLSSGSSNKPFLTIYQGGAADSVSLSNTALSINQWNHVAYVLNNTNALIYINGNQTGYTANSKTPWGVNRDFNFIGRGFYDFGQKAFADIDEIKLFADALSNEEIRFHMNNDIY